MIPRLLSGTNPKVEVVGDVMISDQYVFVDAVDEDGYDDDDEIVVIHTADIVHPDGPDDCKTTMIGDTATVIITAPLPSTVVVSAVGVATTTTTKENEVEEDCWNEMRCVEDVVGVDVWSETRTKFQAGTMILLLLTLLLFDAGDLYVLLHGSNTNAVPDTFTTFKGIGFEQRRLKYVPVAAPTKNREEVGFRALPEIHWDTPQVPSDYDSTVRQPTHRRMGNLHAALMVPDTSYDATVPNDVQSGCVVSPMIPTVRRSTAIMMILTQPVSAETPRVSTEKITSVGNVPTTTIIAHSSSSYIPMRSLIPYTSPRRIEKMNHIPSVRDYNDWIPTNNWTVASSSSLSSSIVEADTRTLDIEMDSFPAAVTTIHPPDRRPWSIDGTDGSTTTIATATTKPPPPQQVSVVLTEYTFRDFIQQYDHVMVTFYYPCHRYVTKFVPLWTNFTNALASEQIPVITATVDCHSHPNICREQGCYRFPTIRWFYKGNVHVEDYNRGRNAHKLLRFVKNTLEEINERSAQYVPSINGKPVKAPKYVDADSMNSTS